jgi:hypothetical protein
MATAILELDLPASRVLTPAGGGDTRVDLDVSAQVVQVGDRVELRLFLGLVSDMLAAIPRVEQRL